MAWDLANPALGIPELANSLGSGDLRKKCYAGTSQQSGHNSPGFPKVLGQETWWWLGSSILVPGHRLALEARPAPPVLSLAGDLVATGT